MRSSMIVTLFAALGLLPMLFLNAGGVAAQPTESDSDSLIAGVTDSHADSEGEAQYIAMGISPSSASANSDEEELLLANTLTAINMMIAEPMLLADGHGSAEDAEAVSPETETYPVTDAHGPEFADAHSMAADLRIEPRFNVGHTTSGGWMNGLSRISGWIPLRQQVGEDVTFIEPRLVLDNEGNWGGNLLLGHREYDDDGDRLWAGYASIDIREAEEGICDQLGLGMETLGHKWDVHLNAYMPIGTCRKNIEESFSGTGAITSLGTPQFQGNQLLLTGEAQTIRSFTDQVAVGGFDLGTTVELVEWDDGDGDLRALAGIYHLGALGINDAFGWRLGLEARPTEQIVLGVTYQEDEMFGSNVMASITASFRRVRPKDDVLEEFEENFEVVERLGEPIRRNHTIVMNTISGREIDVQDITEPLENPQNGTANAAYRFIHVDLGAASDGNGTAESPYNNIDSALADASQNSGTAFGNPETAENQIVYVDASSSADIDAFEIPAGVRVLSQAPTQVINGSNTNFLSFFPQEEGRLPFSPDNNFNTGIAGEATGFQVTLPNSGDADFPVVSAGADDLIVMNSNTVLSGFIINDATSDAIFANSAENVEIRDSFINNAGERGIFLSDVSGSVVLFDNTLATTGEEGIFIQNTTPGTNIEVTARRQIIDDARVGISVDVGGGAVTTGNSTQIVEIEDTQITNSAEQGLLLTASEIGSQEVSFSAVSGAAFITGSGQEGILIEADTAASQEVRIEDATIFDNGLDGTHAGIQIIGSIQNSTISNNTSAQEIFIFDNFISENTGAGIDIEGNGSAAQEFGISGNLISLNDGGGIISVANNLVFQEFVTDEDNDANGVFNNFITENTGQGIDFDANNQATLLSDISQNILSNTATTEGDPEIEITSNDNTTNLCAYVADNTASDSSIVLDNSGNGLVEGVLFEVVDLGDLLGVLSSNATESGTVTLLPDSSSFEDKEGATDSCFTDAD